MAIKPRLGRGLRKILGLSTPTIPATSGYLQAVSNTGAGSVSNWGTWSSTSTTTIGPLTVGITTPSTTWINANPSPFLSFAQGIHTSDFVEKVPFVDVGALGKFQLHALLKQFTNPIVDNGYVICEDLRIAFKYDKPNITKVPKNIKSCRMIEVTGKDIPFKDFIGMMNTILVFNSNKSYPVPARKYDSVGFDLYCSETVQVNPGEMEDIPTGVHCGFPPHVWGLLVNRSSTFRKKLIMPTAIIDPGFTGELKICLFNVGKEMYIAQPGERLGQLIPMQDVMGVRMEQVENKEDLPETARGDKGFGSTGK